MSSEEKKRRADYIKNRNKWIMIHLIVLGCTFLLTLVFSIIYTRMNENYYINYTETSDIDYKVYLKPNNYYEEEFLGEDKVYVSSLIDNVTADFKYELKMDSNDIEYKYSYKIDAQLTIVDNKTKTVIYNPVEEIVKEMTFTQNSSNTLSISHKVVIPYDVYNEIAKSFIGEYGLTDIASTLVVKAHINVLSECDDFENNENNKYQVSLNIPLTEKTTNINMTSSVPTSETKVLACDRALSKNVFKILGIIFGSLCVISLISLILFTYLTRNIHVNYMIKVKRIVSNYKSYIQQIKNEFDVKGYQVLFISTFNEMLEIRDTIQSPILMSENDDRTCTKFLIPTETKLLYVFEIKVDDYDEIYDTKEA